jgi:hypothetical protein
MIKAIAFFVVVVPSPSVGAAADVSVNSFQVTPPSFETLTNIGGDIDVEVEVEGDDELICTN